MLKLQPYDKKQLHYRRQQQQAARHQALRRKDKTALITPLEHEKVKQQRLVARRLLTHSEAHRSTRRCKMLLPRCYREVPQVLGCQQRSVMLLVSYARSFGTRHAALSSPSHPSSQYIVGSDLGTWRGHYRTS